MEEPETPVLLDGKGSSRSIPRRNTRKPEDLPLDPFETIANTYRLEGRNRALLHGYLHIQILNAKNLRNRDCSCIFSFNTCRITKDLSDPYVTVHAGPHRILKTRWIEDDLNPVWNEDFYIPVAHHVDGIRLKVKDQDFLLYGQMLGQVFVPVKELVRYSREGKPLRVAIHKVAWLDEKAHHGSLEFFIDFVPVELLNDLPMEVPGLYFGLTTGNRVQMYVNAEDGPQYGAPEVRYGANQVRTWKAARLWRDTYDAICEAKHLIYVTGWSVDVTQSLLRGVEKDKAIKSGKYSPYIGELLKQKADEGVSVLMLIWDDATSNAVLSGMMGTHDEEAKRFFRDTKVEFRLCPMAGDEINAVHEKAGKWVMFTHHQKVLITDAPQEDRKGARELLAFIGGVDLTNGRWDNREHPLFRSLKTDHIGDCQNACFDVDAENVGPREPWHDIHSSVRGPATLDIVQNFSERWNMQTSGTSDTLIDLQKVEIGKPTGVDTNDETWCNQLFRSIDERTTKYSKDDAAFVPMGGVVFPQGIREKSSFRQRMFHGGTPQTEEMEFTAADASTFYFHRALECKKGRKVDNSIHRGLIHHIRRAEHMVYIESQYFLSSSFLWPTSEKTKCGNLIAAELTLKICQKIEAGERFCAYILVPMWPEGLPDSQAVQAILRFQFLTMQGIYKRIAASLTRRMASSKEIDDESMSLVHPRDYLSFYCLANRELSDGDSSSRPPTPKTDEERLARTRRHQIYVHSKMFIIDDTIAMIGSANVNQRSLDGARDSEIVLGSWQPAHLATKESVPHGDVHGFRLHCWATIAGRMEEVFREPSSLACVRRLNEIADENWEAYTSSTAQEMTSHIVPYPIVVGDDGSITPRTSDGCFPDTKGYILGQASSVLPEFLTT